MAPVTIDELKKVVAVKDLPDDLLQWIIDHSTIHEYEDGTSVRKFGDPMNEMYFMLAGSLNFYMDVNGRQVFYFSFDNDTMSGGVGGLLPYSRMKTSPGYSYAVGKLRMMTMNKEHFVELEHLSPSLIQKLIGYMTERARQFATVQLQHEKVNALGKLAAGIAHELNNPAAAINRIADELGKRIKLNYALTEKMLVDGIGADHLRFISNMVEEKEKAGKPKLSAMQRIQLEDDIDDWLQQNKAGGDRELAETFTEAGFTNQDLDSIVAKVGQKEMRQLIYWLENVLSSQRITKDLDDASTRISSLVTAIKSHVHMDRTNELQPTNIHNDIDNTLTLLGYKLREKNISVNKTYCDNIIDIPAVVGELNQVWTNLIDNAIFAVEKNGELTIETSCDQKNVRIKIIDNGSGIPPEIKSRIFDPFFTTKKVGQGTGIGLDLVNRIVKRHHGDIKVDSVPGRTEFMICIPVTQEQPEKK